MSEQAVPVTTAQPARSGFWEADDFDNEAYDRLREQIEHAMESQFSQVFSKDPRILELDELDGCCFTASPWTTYGENCWIRDNASLEQALQETRTASLKDLDEFFGEEYEQRGKNTEEHRQGRERFHTLLESLILEHLPAFVAQHPDLAVQYATITKQNGKYMSTVASYFLNTLESACEATCQSPATPDVG